MSQPADWTDLLVEPLAIRGAYGERGPLPSTFIFHAANSEAHQVSVAGEFTELPRKLPDSWNAHGRAVAYVIFQLIDVKSSHIDPHLPRGTPLPFTLESTPELWATAPGGRSIYYRRFFTADSRVDITAAHIHAVVGQRAMGAYGWAKIAV
jgi:hypothetical protein